jgi:HK97 family phage portal protein
LATLWSRAKRLVSKAFNLRTTASSPSQRTLVDALGGHGTSTQAGWTGDRHEQVRHYRSWAFVAVRAIANQLAVHPPIAGLVRSAGEGESSKSVSQWIKQKSLSANAAQGNADIEHLDPYHPLVRLLANPNEPHVSYDLWFQHVLFKCLTGNSYWWCPPNGFGLPAEIWVIPSPWVTPEYSGSGKWVDGYTVRTYRSGRQFHIPAEDMIHFSDPNPLDMRDGFSTLGAGSHWIDSQYSIDRGRLFAFKQSTMPSMILTLDGDKYLDPTQDVLERIYEKVEARMIGENNYRRLVILPPGVQHQAAVPTPHEMDFINSSNQIRDMVLALFGVPYTVAMIVGGATHENYDESTLAFHRYTMNPLCTWTGQVLTEKLAKRFDPRAVLFWTDHTPTSPKQLNEDLDVNMSHGIMTVNEARKIRGLDPIKEPWADIPGGQPPGMEDKPERSNRLKDTKAWLPPQRNGYANHD